MIMKMLLIFLSIVSMTFVWSLPAGAFDEVAERPSRHLEIEVWLNKHNGAVYQPGQHVCVYFRSSDDCYLVVYNVDTEGFVHVLYPKYNDNSWVEADYIYEIPDPNDDYDLVVDGPKGIEYVVAVASPFPLNVRTLYDIETTIDEVYWPMGRITGDPHLAIYEINQRLAWGEDEYDPEGYASDVSWFYVHQWVPYPRYIAYHWYPEYIYDPWWDPYVHVDIWLDFYWDHYWCRPWWWCRGCQPIYVYWYIDRDTGRRATWKGDYHTDRRKPDWYRDKPLRRGGGGERSSHPSDTNDPTSWENRRRSPWGDPGSVNEELIKERNARKDVGNLESHSKSRPHQADRDQMEMERRSKDPSYDIDQGDKNRQRSRTEIHTPGASKKTGSEEIARSRSSQNSEPKKIKKSSGRGSSLGKIIGSVTKIFTGDSKKEKNNSQQKSNSSNTQKERSSSSSNNEPGSEKGGNTERKSR